MESTGHEDLEALLAAVRAGGLFPPGRRRADDVVAFALGVVLADRLAGRQTTAAELANLALLAGFGPALWAGAARLIGEARAGRRFKNSYLGEDSWMA